MSTNGAGASAFYPLDHRGRSLGGTAATFDLARVCFEAAWKAYLPLCTETDFAEHRRQRAWTDWKYRMLDAGTPLPHPDGQRPVSLLLWRGD